MNKIRLTHILVAFPRSNPIATELNCSRLIRATASICPKSQQIVFLSGTVILLKFRAKVGGKLAIINE